MGTTKLLRWSVTALRQQYVNYALRAFPSSCRSPRILGKRLRLPYKLSVYSRSGQSGAAGPISPIVLYTMRSAFSRLDHSSLLFDCSQDGFCLLLLEICRSHRITRTFSRPPHLSSDNNWKHTLNIFRFNDSRDREMRS